MFRSLRSLVARNLLRGYQTSATQPQAIAVDELRARVRNRISDIDKHGLTAPSLYDSFRRKHDYLRISLTERCNLRCFYCMPSEGVELSPSTSILSDDEIIRLALLFVQNGVTKIRLTGGEPTVRKNISRLVARLGALRQHGLKSLAMTSNGIALHRKLPELVENGLTHLNLSLDTLDPFKFEIMTRRPGHEAVMRALDVARKCSGLESLKMNMVVIRGLNDMEVPQFLELTKETPMSVRFIEFMPFTGNKWDKTKMVPSFELLSQIKKFHPGILKLSDEVNDTAKSYQVPGYCGSFGFISSMSDHFCASCNRLRITADGQIKVCLFDSKEVSLRDLMRTGGSENELLSVIQMALGQKKEKHEGMEDIDVVNNRPMILIGDHHSVLPPRSKTSLGSIVRVSSHSISSKSRNATIRYRSTVASLTANRRLTHLDEQGRPAMVDVSNKDITQRAAVARGRIFIPQVAYDLVRESSEGVQSEAASQQHLDADTLRRRAKAKAKGNVLTVAQLAGIMASKRTSDLIPLCHPIPLSHVAVELRLEAQAGSGSVPASDPSRRSGISQFSIVCEATVACDGKTGVEMEALTAVSTSLLTVWDMLKAVAGKEMTIGDICVVKKSGGKSGDFTR